MGSHPRYRSVADLSRPPKIKTIRIIENPFDDIVPRITAAERKAQMQARIESKRDIEQREKRAKAKKSASLPNLITQADKKEHWLAFVRRGGGDWRKRDHRQEEGYHPD